jgi:hypothetical protein
MTRRNGNIVLITSYLFLMNLTGNAQISENPCITETEKDKSPIALQNYENRFLTSFDSKGHNGTVVIGSK